MILILYTSFLIQQGSKNKGGCHESCKAICKYSTRELNHAIFSIGKKELISEMIAHGHPSSRKFSNGRSRSIEEGRKELLEHYIYSHHVNS